MTGGPQVCGLRCHLAAGREARCGDTLWALEARAPPTPGIIHEPV